MARRGRVLIVVENLPVPFDRRVWLEATTLREAGYSVSVICPANNAYPEGEAVLEGVRIYRHALPPEGRAAWGYLREYAGALWHEFRLALRIARKEPIEIVHICNPPDLLFTVAAWLKWRYGTTVIFDHHDLAPELYEAKYRRRDGWYRLLRLAERATFGTADYVISTNESYREVALQRGRQRRDRVFVVRSGPELRRFRRVAPNSRYKNGRAVLVGYVGVMGQQEGIDLLLEAAAWVWRWGRTDIQFAVVGSGPVLDDLNRLRDELGLKDMVELPGRVPEDELIERLSTCDICVNPDPKTPFNDRSTMNKILEYMALGVPVVQFDLLEGRRSAGDASLYAEPNDPEDLARQIVRLADDPALRERMGREGRHRMEEALEWRHQAPTLLRVYEEAMEQRQKEVGRSGAGRGSDRA